MKPWLTKLIDELRGEKLNREKIAEAAYAALTSFHGKILLAYLLQEIFFSISYQPGQKCCDTAANEGQRMAVRHLLDLMNEYMNPPEETVVEK
jgi:hypothetical protein